MRDRVPMYPGRVRLTPVPGQDGLYDMVRADRPTQEGTPLNKATLLSDETAAMLGLPKTATPDDAFRMVPGVGDIFTSARADFWEECGDGIVPCVGQILPADQYPLYAKRQGPILGYTWEEVSVSGFPYVVECMIQLSSGRILISGILNQSEYSTRRRIWKSDDNGQSWTQSFNVQQDTEIPILQKVDGTVLAFAKKSVRVSTDNGSSWQSISLNQDVYYGPIVEVTNGRLITSKNNTVFSSDDNGKTWGRCTTSSISTLVDMRVSEDGVIYGLYTAYQSDYELSQIYRSEDEGRTWKVVFSENVPTNQSGPRITSLATMGGLKPRVVAIGRNYGTFLDGAGGPFYDVGGNSGWRSDKRAKPAVSAYRTIHMCGRIMVNADGNWMHPGTLPKEHNAYVYLALKNGDLLACPNLTDGTGNLFHSKPDASIIVLPHKPGFFTRVK